MHRFTSCFTNCFPNFLQQFFKNVLCLALLLALLIQGSVLALATETAEEAATASFLDRVENLSTTNVSNTSLSLSFDPVLEATEYLVFYGTESVTDSSQSYQFGPVKTTDLEVELTDLEPETQYFVAVVATDAAIFSQFYSKELTVSTINTDATVGTTSFIKESATPSKQEILLTFSREMQFTGLVSTKLAVEKIFDGKILTIKSLDIIDTTHLKLTIAEELEPGAEYLVQIKADLLDLNNTAMEEKDKNVTVLASLDLGEALDTGLKVDAVNTLLKDRIEVVMNLDVDVNEAFSSKIAVIETQNPDVIIDVKLAEANKLEKNRFLLVLASELKANTDYSLVLTDIVSSDNLSIAEADSIFNFKAQFADSDSPVAPATDPATTPGTETGDAANNFPSEVSSLKAIAQSLEASSAAVSYKKAQDVDGDLKAHNVYLKGAGSEFELNTSVSKDTESLNVQLGDISPSEGLLKVTAIDENGNETEGRVTPIRIPGVGPAGIVWLFLGSFGLAALNRKEEEII